MLSQVRRRQTRGDMLSQLRRRETTPGVGAAREQQRELERRICAMDSVRTLQRDCKNRVVEIIKEWQALLAALSEREYQLHGQFQSVRFKKVFDESVDNTRKWVHGMQGPQRCFGSHLDKMLNNIHIVLLHYGDNMQHWRDYLDAGKRILKSLQTLQHEAVAATALNTQKLDNPYTIT